MTDLSYRHGNVASTSSIYDYPEHLNPFYEDENHKRLRFWNHKPASNRSQRRGSFSSLRDGIREFWQYSSTHFRKKRSSTLGVNKTSESPPPLRREVYAEDNYATVGGSGGPYRNTVNVTGYETPARQTQSYSNTPLFVRHSRYRGSMQSPSTKDNEEIGFTRNDRYRSTIQNGFSTYSTGMVTSTPRKKQAPALPYSTTSRVPQQHGNTNPFDEPMDQDGDTLSTFSLDDGDGSTLRSRKNGTKMRTKRRAPPPPPNSTQTSSTSQAIDESSANDGQNEDLRNLAAEIESFVRVSSTTGDDALPQAQTNETNDADVVQPCDVNNNAESTEIPTTVSAIEREIVQVEVRAADNVPKETVTAQPTAAAAVAEKTVLTNKSEDVPLEDPIKATDTSADRIVVVENGQSTPPLPASPIPIPRRKQDRSEVVPLRKQPDVVPSEIDFEQLALPETPVPTRRMSRERYMAQQVTTVEKPAPKVPIPKATPAAASTAAAEADEDDGPTTTIIVDNMQYKLKVAPIPTEINTKIESARMKISESTNNIPAVATVANDQETAERRRSVRDIIESINKSQSMLKFNHDQSTSSLQSTQSTDSVTRNIRELNEREKEIQNLLQDINSCYGAVSEDDPSKGDSSVISPAPAAAPLSSTGRGSYYDNLADDNLCANLDDGNQAVGGGRVKKSPTKTLILSEGTDEQQYLDCMDWNPVPKPRRSNVP